VQEVAWRNLHLFARPVTKRGNIDSQVDRSIWNVRDSVPDALDLLLDSAMGAPKAIRNVLSSPGAMAHSRRLFRPERPTMLRYCNLGIHWK